MYSSFFCISSNSVALWHSVSSNLFDPQYFSNRYLPYWNAPTVIKEWFVIVFPIQKYKYYLQGNALNLSVI
jgi:hypothetical protein